MDFGCCLYSYHKIPKKLTGSNGKIGKLIYSYLRIISEDEDYDIYGHYQFFFITAQSSIVPQLSFKLAIKFLWSKNNS